MKIIKIKPNNPQVNLIKKAADILGAGGTLIYPTDTAYGLGANALDRKAIEKIYEIKGREYSKPMHVVVRDWAMIENFCYTNEVAKKLYSEFLPGPLTIVLMRKPIVPDILIAGGVSLGIRIPNNPVTKLISREVDFPYTATSSNPAGGKTPYSIAQAIWQFTQEQQGSINLILDTGRLPKTAPSTIIDCSVYPPKILREGPVGRTEIEKALQLKVE